MNRKQFKRRGQVDSSTNWSSNIVLNNTNPKPPTHSDKSVDEGKVINSLNRLKSKAGNDGDNIYLKVILGVPEAQYIESNQEMIIKTLKESFDIVDLTLSPSISGTIERFMTISGNLSGVIKACLFVSFIICLQLNNIEKIQTFTLKSNNYKLCLIFQDACDKNVTARHSALKHNAQALSHFDMAPMSFNPQLNLFIIELIGDFTALFNFLEYLVSLSQYKHNYLDDSNILEYPIIYTNDSNLYQRQEVNSGVLDDSTRNIMTHIYEESYLNQLDIK